MKRIAPFLLFAFLAAFAGAGAESPAPKPVEAHPVLWRVTGDHGTVTILGSVHVLPANVHWQTPEIQKAWDGANVAVFEIPIDADTVNRIQTLVAERGLLPEGKKLRDMLPADSKADLGHVLTELQLPEGAVSNKRPWLVTLMIDTIVIQKQMEHFTLGADSVLTVKAKENGKEIRYLETVDKQLALIAPQDPAVELQALEEELKSFDTEDDDIAAIIAAWTKGDAAAMNKVLGGEFKDHPEAQAVFFTERNKVWAEEIEAMLHEHKNFFITVGAGHLVGKDSVPSLLRAKGFKVEGP